jgi:hypothetical protein
MFKICSKCKISKPIDKFYRQVGTKDGFTYQCGECSSKRIKNTIDTSIFKVTSEEELATRTIKEQQNIIENQQIKKLEYLRKTKHLRSLKTKNKLQTDPLFKLRHNLKNLIRNSIKNTGFKKTTKTALILGCSVTEFKQHIERQFNEGMSWSNYGKWEYDHIKPVSWAKTESEIIALNHYSNFQPLWREDNRKKSNKFCG